MTDEASKAAKLLGRLGGAKGGKATGKSKVRGDSAYYKALGAKRNTKKNRKLITSDPDILEMSKQCKTVAELLDLIPKLYPKIGR